MFGKSHPFWMHELPPGRFRKRLERLHYPSLGKAMDWMHRFDFPHHDVHSLDVDADGAVFYVDSAPQPAALAAAVTDADTIPVAAANAADDAFVLHSRPGASNVVYIDVNGHILRNTAWNGVVGVDSMKARAFDLDGRPASFNDEEKLAIAEIWHRVAEDYAAFDVDVTTERPERLDNSIGHILITSNTSADAGPMPYPSSGGIAYINVWGRSSYRYYRPALVYYDNLGSHPALIAEAASHELGHNLGLSHDGTSSDEYYAGHGIGNTSWAPIMGTNYGRNVTQWSRGEYPDANNTQDDVAIIESKFGLMDDDHPDTLALATPLLVENTEILVSDPELDPHNQYPDNKGIIETPTDVDLFGFDTGSGLVQLTITPAWQAFERDTRRGANLDVRARLLDSSGTLIASANPADDTHAEIATTLAAGRYYLEISGSGSDNYPEYASLGQYFITGTVAEAAPNLPPTATFNVACIGLSCTFSDASHDPDGSIVSHLWEFGDGGTSSIASPTHTYASAGTFTATHTVTDDQGMSSSEQYQVSPQAPPQVSGDIVLTVGIMDNGEYGSNFGSDQHPLEVNMRFVATGTDLTFSVTGYDIGYFGEVLVYLNGERLGPLSKGPADAFNKGDVFEIPASLQQAGENELRIARRRSGGTWGVTRLLLSDSGATAPEQSGGLTLVPEIMDPGAYGSNFGTDQHPAEVIAHFDGTSDDLTFSLSGYDIGYFGEVLVYLNDQRLGPLSKGPAEALNDGDTFNIPASQQLDGPNTLRIARRNPGGVWGVTHLLLSY